MKKYRLLFLGFFTSLIFTGCVVESAEIDDDDFYARGRLVAEDYFETVTQYIHFVEVGLWTDFYWQSDAEEKLKLEGGVLGSWIIRDLGEGLFVVDRDGCRYVVRTNGDALAGGAEQPWIVTREKSGRGGLEPLYDSCYLMSSEAGRYWAEFVNTDVEFYDHTNNGNALVEIQSQFIDLGGRDLILGIDGEGSYVAKDDWGRDIQSVKVEWALGGGVTAGTSRWGYLQEGSAIIYTGVDKPKDKTEINIKSSNPDDMEVYFNGVYQSRWYY